MPPGAATDDRGNPCRPIFGATCPAAPTSTAPRAPAQPHPWPFATLRKKANAGLLESREDQGFRGALKLVPLALEIADGAARNAGGGSELILSPIQQPTRGAA